MAASGWVTAALLLLTVRATGKTLENVSQWFAPRSAEPGLSPKLAICYTSALSCDVDN
jgi:hypothetical protein